ncbi:Tetratricopeptide repeat-like superfamily protein [Prunus dulcis]|uniref:Tetratricopeptide repeat-like superfamily protein n=1 Tax=Prunus dulcis TaxID=3755 RepID=A0A4Y1QX92_PRUDU|nr:Tetratricopeptide repeat-like superfamily protein [Prunus dulcis]
MAAFRQQLGLSCLGPCQLLPVLDVTAAADFGRPRGFCLGGLLESILLKKILSKPKSSFPSTSRDKSQTRSYSTLPSPSCVLDCSSAVGGQLLFCSSDVVYQGVDIS